MSVGARRSLSAVVVSLCVLVGALALGSAPALAAAPEVPVTGEASLVTTTTATLNGELGELNPENALEVGTYEFLYWESATTCEGGETAPVPAGVVLSKEHVSQSLSGLLPGATYTFCLLARNAAEETALGAPVTFTTLAAAPTIASESVSTVESTEATFNAQIDPNGAETTYHFEYDTTPYTSSAPHGTSITKEGENTAVDIGPGTSPVSVEVKVKGLTPGATYYYRVVASNAQSPAGGTPGPNKTFTTTTTTTTNSEACPNEQARSEQPFALKLPDCRAYEMVSPAQTGGQDATLPRPAWKPRAAVSGEALTYSSRGSFAEPTGGNVENQYLSRRGPEGWTTQSITPLRDPLQTESRTSYEGDAFTPELTEGIASTNDPLVEGAPGGKKEGENGLYLADLRSGSYEYVASVGTETFAFGVSSDLSRIMLQHSEWIDGSIVPVMVSNEGEAISGTVGEEGPASLAAEKKDLWQAVSSDGSRVYFTSPETEEEPGVAQLFVRVNVGQPQSPIALNSGGECTVAADACTVEVSASQRFLHANPAGIQPTRYWGASADGSKVFFTSNAELTEDAYTGPDGNGANLYEYDLESGKLTDLTGETTDSTGNGAAVQGVVQISEEGQYVYFVANGVLTSTANARGEYAKPGNCEPEGKGVSCNLYVSHEGGPARFIATLAAGDSFDWDGGELWKANEAGPGVNTAVVNPSGARLAFVSSSELTGYDNQQAAHGACEGEGGLCSEVFLYDAESQGLVCASCDPTGARPVGPSSLSAVQHVYGLYRERDLLEDGALFFDSSDALVPHASDGRQNVYEYEDGHVYAISNVAGGFESFFMDASASGKDVFFATSDQLLPQDRSDSVVVWDARVDGGFPAPPAAPSCENADSCKPPVSLQPAAFGAPASASFSGSGNATPPLPSPAVVKPKPKSMTVRCKKNFVKKKIAKKETCVKRKSEKRAKRASRDRRGK